jgi:phosphoserine phosphatase RsbU/P
MKVLGSAPNPVLAAARTGLPPVPAGDRADEPFDRVARLAAMILGTPLAAVSLTEGRPAGGRSDPGSGDVGGLRGLVERSLCRKVIDSADELIVSDARLDPRMSAISPVEPGSVLTWAGFPVRDPDGQVTGALWVADYRPRQWSAGDIEILRTLALVASGEVALRIALERGAEAELLARTLQESLLPPRLPKIPGLQVAARYAAGGTGSEVLGDFYDVFPSVQGSWGMAVGDVCGKGVAAAKSTALARYTLRAEAHRETRPSRILATLNRALLDWLTDDPRFLTAIYATVRPTLAGASVRVSSAGHPLALVRRADGRVQTLGQPGTLLGLLPEPELHDSRGLLRAGDSMILFTDGVTEARGHADRDLFGDDRLSSVIARLGDESATGIAEAIQRAVHVFSGAAISDDTVALVLKVPAQHAHPTAPLPRSAAT